MKFLLLKDIKKDTMMKPVLTGLLFFMFLYMISDIFVKQYSFGIFPDTVKQTLFGNEEEYVDPLSTSSFLEFWHIEIFFLMMLLFTLSAVYIRVVSKYKILITSTLMISAITSLICIYLSFFVSSIFVEVYTVSFILWHATALYMILISTWKLYV